MSVDEGGWTWQIAVLRKQFPGLQLVSGFRNNAVTAGSGSVSYHARGRAVDVPPRADVFNWIAANYPQSEELIFTPMGTRQIHNGKSHVYTGQTAKDHYNHVHWAIIDQVAPSGGVVNASLSTDPVSVITGAGQFVSFITTPGLWARVGLALAGLLLLLIGLARLAGNPLKIKLPSAVKNVSRSASN